MQKIKPCLLFDNRAEDAMNFYVSIFKNSKIVNIARCGDAGPGPKGSVLTVTFELDGEEFFAINGGQQYAFSPAMSFFVTCETQQEVDELWEKLLEGGGPNSCGWLYDKFGVSWQIVPSILGKLLHDSDPRKSAAVMRAMLQMQKLDIQGLQEAHDQA